MKIKRYRYFISSIFLFITIKFTDFELDFTNGNCFYIAHTFFKNLKYDILVFTFDFAEGAGEKTVYIHNDAE